MPRDTAHVADIIESARIARACLTGVERDDFLRNVQLQDAVIRRIEIMGEAARRVSMQFRERHAEISWRKMIGMRNRLIHAFDLVELDLVWTTVQVNVPELLALLEPLVTSESVSPPPGEHE